jgi:DNA (cytosine-5)-methyltransferase 1
MRYLSLFAGIGGFDLALDRYGYECVGYSEIHKPALQVYHNHFPGRRNYGDIRGIDPERLPDHDLLCGGFPCQSFSQAGERNGFSNPSGRLFFEVARIAAAKRPRFVCLENVSGLLHHDDGQTFASILITLSQLGYLLEWQVLNGKNFGVPQHRERVFLVGHLGGASARPIFPIAPTTDGHLSLFYNKQSKYRFYSSNRLMRTDGIATTLTKRCAIVMLTEQGRTLTPRECERLMGFPDDWTLGISEAQRYNCLGEAVVVPVVEEIAKRISVQNRLEGVSRLSAIRADTANTAAGTR